MYLVPECIQKTDGVNLKDGVHRPAFRLEILEYVLGKELHNVH